ncbi:hypothetical protein [Parachitinimonas caeni]|uniref:Uncharacterized protein n=1 Tax=Parachitinimonas caeni TaxID=3031301 RepID=A0ABT7DVN5_9NEIS|nr:hypothetical protein [Parachitinimonas caeni]MDK2123220.1 hypothetical protein [Parachitinimonas caeni]
MEKSTKIVILGGVVAMGLATGTANATAVSAAASATGAVATFTVPTGTASAGGFVTNSFTFKLSNNVSLAAQDSSTAVAVSSASTKGTRVFGGSSNGGGIKDCSGSSVANPAPKATPDADKDGCS